METNCKFSIDYKEVGVISYFDETIIHQVSIQLMLRLDSEFIFSYLEIKNVRLIIAIISNFQI